MDEQAFPMIAHDDPLYGGRIAGQRGMTLRDYFAAAALTGLLAGRSSIERTTYGPVSYEFADAMMEARALVEEQDG